MDLQALVNKFKVIAGVYAFDILPDGSYSHTLGGDTNDTATVQALYSFIAYKRMTEGRSPIFVFDNRQPVSVNAEQPESHSSSSQNNADEKTSATANEKLTDASAASATAAATAAKLADAAIPVPGLAVPAVLSLACVLLPSVLSVPQLDDLDEESEVLEASSVSESGVSVSLVSLLSVLSSVESGVSVSLVLSLSSASESLSS